jgi:ubiquinone/menaquinone biosynthesis C-methylase UbiE
MTGEVPGRIAIGRRSHFDALASRWDDMRPAGAQDDVVERGLALVGPLDGRMVVDLGSGTGLLEGHLLRHIGAGRIVAIDSSPEMLARARSKHPDARVEWLCRDVLATALPDGCADVVLCYNTWPHFDHPGRVRHEIGRWLRPGGQALVWHDIGRDRLAAIHEEAGGAIAQDRLPAVGDLGGLFAAAGFSVLRAHEDADSYTLLARWPGEGSAT